MLLAEFLRAVRALSSGFLAGSYTPLVTPIADGRPDCTAFQKLVELQVEAGSSGVVVCGTSGEPSLLSIAERQQLAEAALEAADGRIKVLVATGSQSLDETVALTNHAERSGADGLLIVTPYYVRPPERGLIAYFARLAEHTSLPWLLYHIPGRAAVSVSPEVLDAIASSSESFVGIKHAAPDLALVSDCLAHFGPEFRVMVGLEELSLPMLAIGASGVINAVGNIAPGAVQALCDAVAAGDLKEARRLHYDLLELNRAVFWDTNPIPIKYLMKRMGLLADNQHRLPMAPAAPDLEARLDVLAERWGLLAASSPAPIP